VILVPADSLLNLLSAIQQHRLAVLSGNYGVSESSGDPIAYERLLLIPWARNDIDE
jgi:RNA polymerase-binding transcription factor DksA